MRRGWVLLFALPAMVIVLFVKVVEVMPVELVLFASPAGLKRVGR